MFTNREEAAELLADKLISYSNNKDVVVAAIPRGGVPLGAIIAKKLKAPLEIVLSKKIGHPLNKEYAIGAVTLKSSILSERVPGVSKLYIDNEIKKVRELLKERHKKYYGNILPIDLKGKIVILVDDGVATGNTLISCVQLIELQKPSKIIVALPVGPHSAIKKIKNLPIVENMICLFTPHDFSAVGQFYEDFGQVNDAEVIALLKEAKEGRKLNYSDM